MLGRALILAGAAAALAAAAPAAAPGHEAEVGRAIFDLCPKVLDGSLRLDDPAALAAIGYGATPPRQTPSGPIPRATRGAGAEMVVLSGQMETDGGGCATWFGGPDNKRLFKAMRKRALKSAFQGSGRPAKLGDGTDIYSYRAVGMPRRTLVFIAGAAGDGVGGGPTTTAVMMDTKSE
ncbi:MAG: hypothetical protein QOG72_1917 [Sphingomonadales bacterium]|jgi:hypothetical protein|nr:hypothetical protein [Sphingomonadales bacterium]